MPPGTSVGSGRSSSSASTTGPMRASDQVAPTSAATALGACAVMGAMPAKPMPASATVHDEPSALGASSTRKAPPASAMSSSRRRACLNACTYSNFRVKGRNTRSSTSSGFSSVLRYDLKKDVIGTVRCSPVGAISVTRAPAATSVGFKSLIGDAVAMLPARAATLRIWLDANQRSIEMTAPKTPACSGRSRTRSRHASPTSVSDTQPPTSRPPRPSTPGASDGSTTCSSCSSGTCIVWMRTGYSMFLNLVSMPTSVLPTISFASGAMPLSSSSWSSVVGRNHKTRAPSRRSGRISCLVCRYGGKMGSASPT
mmetsp:Transcript_9321/g.32839  ORF Transcript_9321/g.32839 Transcript_9321/m.32839 type:complete len:312 (+) Transcript_9321:246-1181(+)